MLIFIGIILTVILFIIALVAGVFASAIPVTQYNYPAAIQSGAVVLILFIWFLIYVFGTGSNKK